MADDSLSKLMSSFRISDEAFEEVFPDSDDDKEIEQSKSDYRTRIDASIAECAKKNVFNITISVLRSHFKDEKDVTILDMMSGSITDPELFAIFNEYSKEEVDEFFEKIKTLEVNPKLFQDYRCKIQSYVMGKHVEKTNSELFKREMEHFHRKYYFDHAKAKLEIEDGREELKLTYRNIDKLATQIKEKAVKREKEGGDVEKKDYTELVEENKQLKEKVEHLRQLKAQFEKLPSDKLQELRELHRECEFMKEAARDVGMSTSSLSSNSLDPALSFSDQSSDF